MVESKTNLLEFHIDECALSIIDETRGEISRGNFVSMAVEFALGSARFRNSFKKLIAPKIGTRVGQEIDDKILQSLKFGGEKRRLGRRAIINWVMLGMKKNPPSEDYIRKRLSRLSETGILVSEESVYGGKKKTYYRLAAGDVK